MAQQTVIYDLIAALQTSLATQQTLLSLLAAQPEPEPREARLKRMQKAMHTLLPADMSSWHGWAGSYLLADAALDVLDHPEDGK